MADLPEVFDSPEITVLTDDPQLQARNTERLGTDVGG
jgi:hypothetical protein